MTAQVAKGTGAGQSTWIKALVVTLIAAVATTVLGPILWPTSDPPLFPEPSSAHPPFFIVLQVVTPLTLVCGNELLAARRTRGLGSFVSGYKALPKASRHL